MSGYNAATGNSHERLQWIPWILNWQWLHVHGHRSAWEPPKQMTPVGAQVNNAAANAYADHSPCVQPILTAVPPQPHACMKTTVAQCGLKMRAGHDV
jgi:hypothetical protein